MPAYVGINGKARTIAKVYQGNSSGKAEMIYGPYGPARYAGSIPDLSSNMEYINQSCSIQIGDYVLFAGGSSSSTSSTTEVICYDSSLTKISVTPLNTSRSIVAASKVGSYALFAGGINRGTSTYYSTVDTYNASLTKSVATSLSVKRANVSGGYNSLYAIFAGGLNSNAVANVDAYNSSLTRSTATALSIARYNAASGFTKKITSTISLLNNSYALFAGGFTGSNYTSNIEVYDKSLSKVTSVSALNDSVMSVSSVSFDDMAICAFAGGRGLAMTAACSAYGSDLIRINLQDLSAKKVFLAGARLKQYALFAGGSGSSSVDAYDLSTYTKTTTHDLRYSRGGLAGGSVGDYAIFIGGTSNGSAVDAYYIYE